MSNSTRKDGRKAKDTGDQFKGRWRNKKQDMDKTKEKELERNVQHSSHRKDGETKMDNDVHESPSTANTTEKKHGKKRPANQCSYAHYTDSESRSNDGHSSPRHAQAQELLLRQTEASKQMLYGVFGNVITILEEHEKRTSAVGKKKMKQSDITIPDQSWKTNADVKANLETQLLLFQTQSKACPEKVKLSVNRELRRKTIAWFGVREESNIDIDETDIYACRLYEILVQGATKHEILDKPRTQVTEKTIRETLPKIFKGKNDARELDDSFKKDTHKKAEAPKTRQAEVDDAYLLGLSRIERTEPKLKQFVDIDRSSIKHEGPESIL
ncbi:uncharacterized protein LOC128208825 isoform X1 [Mya arenaria]|uniref:uncharacterized protein LOC128208825 isoform X1 n=1 Tax=Mya arenaria TaxID=6604 RepID=UPI0022DF7042|nr:uncharacterized protein LOC128208825 isoform X1 [Mya arenaria]